MSVSWRCAVGAAGHRPASRCRLALIRRAAGRRGGAATPLAPGPRRGSWSSRSVTAADCDCAGPKASLSRALLLRVTGVPGHKPRGADGVSADVTSAATLDHGRAAPELGGDRTCRVLALTGRSRGRRCGGGPARGPRERPARRGARRARERDRPPLGSARRRASLSPRSTASEPSRLLMVDCQPRNPNDSLTSRASRAAASATSSLPLDCSIRLYS